MNTGFIQLIKKLLPGLLPLIIFMVVDEIWGTKAGLIVAIISGFVELVIILLKEKRFDWFIIFDTALLLLLGAVSLLSDNDIFFKLKPAFINLIFCVLIGLSAFSSKNLLLIYSKRYVKDLPDDENLHLEIRKTFRLIFWIFLAHTIMIVYSAFFMSKPAWAFISGGLLYILFAVFFLWQFVQHKIKKKAMAAQEWLPLVDETGVITGKATRSEVHRNPELLHPVVHLHIINSKGQIYLQKRPMNKDIQPGKWDTAVGGHVGLGETIDNALIREAKEELGLVGFTAIPLGKYHWKSDVESELSFSFVAYHNGELTPNKEEVDDGKFWDLNEIEHSLGKGIFTGNFEHEFTLLKPRLFREPTITH